MRRSWRRAFKEAQAAEEAAQEATLKAWSEIKEARENMEAAIAAAQEGHKAALLTVVKGAAKLIELKNAPNKETLKAELRAVMQAPPKEWKATAEAVAEMLTYGSAEAMRASANHKAEAALKKALLDMWGEALTILITAQASTNDEGSAWWLAKGVEGAAGGRGANGNIGESVVGCIGGRGGMFTGGA